MAHSVVSVSLSLHHAFSKYEVPQIQLLAGLGVEGGAHLGLTVQHRSRVAQDPTQPNLQQMHLIHAELFDELAAKRLAGLPTSSAKTSRRLALICWLCR